MLKEDKGEERAFFIYERLFTAVYFYKFSSE